MDLSFVSVDELENMLLINGDEVQFKIKKLDGKTIEIPLTKEMIRADENIIKSFILKGEKSIGYISLPSFYTEFEGQNQLGCANDIAKAIIKMQKEHIDGLIIDLRDNGGGSLKEAIELSGIFIDFGPLSIMENKDKLLTTIKDFNRGSIYNAPLLIMVNGLSASASELFSATMQDYNRGIIVGATTFGKSTGQDIIPLVEDINKKKLTKNELGYVKITPSIFYQLNGVSYQKKGVVPDITLPFFPSENDFSESDYNSALTTDSIYKKIYMPKIEKLPYSELRTKSKNRIANDSIFTKIIEVKDEIENNENDSLVITLSIQGYIKFKNEDNLTENTILEEIDKRITSTYEIHEIVYDNNVLKMDNYTKEINHIAIEQLKKDIYLEESYKIDRKSVV